MTKQKTGMLIFWIGAIYTLIIAGIGGWGEPAIVRVIAEIIPLGGATFFIWAYSVPVGAILMGIGIMLFVDSKKSTVIWYGIGIFATVLILDFFLRGFLLTTKAHFSPLFGIGGVLIITFYVLTVRQWSSKRKTIKEPNLIKSANYQLIGYTFLFLASWWLCENFSTRFSDALSKVNPLSPMNIIIYLVLGWLFIFLSHKQLAKKN